MIFARITNLCGITCERAQLSNSARSTASNSMQIGVFTPISSSLTESSIFTLPSF